MSRYDVAVLEGEPDAGSTEQHGRVTHVRNEPSPAATSTCASAAEIVDRVQR